MTLLGKTTQAGAKSGVPTLEASRNVEFDLLECGKIALFPVKFEHISNSTACHTIYIHFSLSDA